MWETESMCASGVQTLKARKNIIPDIGNMHPTLGVNLTGKHDFVAAGFLWLKRSKFPTLSKQNKTKRNKTREETHSARKHAK